MSSGPEASFSASRTLERVRVITELGDLLIEVDQHRAPATSSAFLEQVDQGRFNGGCFWRTVRRETDRGQPTIEVVQAAVSEPIELISADLEPTSSTGLNHSNGTVSLPRVAGQPSMAVGFFVSIGDNPALDAGTERIADREGFAAFGRVVEGMDVASAIHSREVVSEAPVDYLSDQVLARPVTIYDAAREFTSASDRLAKLAADYWAFRVREFPTEASAAGVSSADPLMDGASFEDHQRRAVRARAMVKRAKLIDPEKLIREEDRTTLSLLRRENDLIVEAFELGQHYRPLLFPVAFTDAPVALAQQTSLLTLKARQDFAIRLAAIPKFLEDNLALLHDGLAAGYRIPRVLVPPICQRIDAHLSVSGLEATIEDALSVGVPGASPADLEQLRSQILQSVRDDIKPALSSIRNFFRLLDDGSLTDECGLAAQPKGREYYRFKIREHASSDLEPDAIHRLGLKEVERVSREMDDLLVAMGRPGERREVASELGADTAPDASTLLSHVRAAAKLIDGRLPTLIGRMPRITYAVESMTAEQSVGQPPALAQPAPADRTMPGIYWLTSLPEKCPLHLVMPLTLHEAWPGHLMQFSIAHELDELPEFRRYCWSQYNAYVEGWALYCERLGYDLRLYDEPRDKFGFLTFELWRASRLVVDTGIHWMGWSRPKAISYMQENSLLPAATIESEVDRYIGMPGQALAYKIGERAISNMRSSAEQRLGERYSLREFHDLVLGTGPVTLDALQARVERWVDQLQMAA